MTAVPFVRSDLRTLRLAQPVIGPSRLAVSFATALAVAAMTLWLVVLPLELLAAI
jgi:hypothetical protein